MLPWEPHVLPWSTSQREGREQRGCEEMDSENTLYYIILYYIRMKLIAVVQ